MPIDRQTKPWAVVRVLLGILQVVAAMTTAILLFQTGGQLADRRGWPPDNGAAAYQPCAFSLTSKLMTPSSPPKRVLFVCVENSNRSQLAEAFARIHGGGQVEAYSAGSKPSGVVNPRAIEAMRERGYDLSSQASKSLDDLPTDREWDFVATMGCGDACPMLRARRREDWNLPDPKHLPPEEYRRVCDDIENRVKAMLSSL